MDGLHFSPANIKKLQFGASKCHKLHVGKNKIVCPKNSIDSWSLEKAHEGAKTILDFRDIEGEPHIMEIVSEDSYLGDILQSDGKNVRNIEERYKRGMGAVKQVCQMLDDLCLGQYHFEAGVLLRNSLVLSSLLSNSESWYNLTKMDICKLESVDEEMLRKLLFAHSKTPIELLYLETGTIPIRFILMSRRLNFLYYILHEEESSLIYQFLETQSKNPSKSDWVKTVNDDLKYLEIQLNFEDIKKTSKTTFKQLVKEKVKTKAFLYLTDLQMSHSKSKELKYADLQLQSYLKPGNSLTIKEKSSIFTARSRMLNVKCNFKIGESDLMCRKCRLAEEDQRHLLICPKLSDNSLSNCRLPDYEDMLGLNTSKIEIIGRILIQRFNLLISNNNLTPLCTDTISCAASTDVVELEYTYIHN